MLAFPGAGRRIAFVCLALLCMQAWAHSAAASPDTTVTPRVLTLARALSLTRTHALTPQSASSRVLAAREQARLAARSEDPTLAASLENFGGSLGGEHREASLVLAQRLELGGKRTARRGVAEANTRLAESDAHAAAHDALLETAERYLNAWEANVRLACATQAAALAAQASDVARQRHAAGATSALEVLRAEQHEALQRLEAATLAHAKRAAVQALTAQWGESDAAVDSLAPPLDAFANASAAPDSLFATAPAIARARAHESLALAQMQATRAARLPDVTLSAGVRRLEEWRATGLVASAELPLPFGARPERSLAIAQHELRAVQLARAAAERAQRSATAEQFTRITAARAQLDAIEHQLLPQQQRLLDESLRAYRAGRSSALEYVTEQANTLALAQRRIDAQAELARAQVRLAALTGTGSFALSEAR